MASNLTLQDKQIVEDLLDGLTITEVAEKNGLHSRTVDRRKSQPQVLAYMDLRRKERGIEVTTRAKIADFRLVEITKAMLVSRLWELAMMDPVITRGNIEGQQRAVDSLWVKVGLEGQAPKVEELQKAKFYRSEWMDEPPN